MALDLCSSGHDEIAFDYNDSCPVCDLHSVFDLSHNSDVGSDRYEKCDTHDCFHLTAGECPGCGSDDDNLHPNTCADHDCSYDHACPACEIEEKKSKDLEDLQDECSRLSEELDQLRNTPKPEPEPVVQKRGYQFF